MRKFRFNPVFIHQPPTEFVPPELTLIDEYAASKHALAMVEKGACLKVKDSEQLAVINASLIGYVVIEEVLEDV